ncbi:MAG: hypothetical protein ACLUI3_02405 [Christensenellales bacterium]
MVANLSDAAGTSAASGWTGVHRGGRDQGGRKLVAQCQEMGVVVHEQLTLEAA